MKSLIIKRMLKVTWIMLLASVVFTSCKEDEEIPKLLVEDGLYVAGEATALSEPELHGLMWSGRNEASSNALRPGMFEKYVAISSGMGFNIVEVIGGVAVYYGPSNMQNVDLAGEREQPNVTIQIGSYAANNQEFTVPESGMYHIILDKTLNKVLIVPVKKWAIIGGATAAGWSDTDLPVGAFSKEAMKFEATGLTLRTGDFKFRHGGGWKIEIDGDTIKANSNFGGTVSGTLPNLTTTMESGASNYAFASANEGVYTVSLNWTVADGFTSSLVKTDDVAPLDYPETLYMVGSALNMADSDSDGTPDGWQWNLTDVPMIPVHSKPHLFWKIVWLEGGGEFKFAPQREWAGDFGVTGDATNGIYSKGGSNIAAPATSGYKMVVVNFETEQIAVVDPKVYLIGNTIGSWDTANPDALFTVDNTNQVLTITKALASDELRMYAWFTEQPWFTDWWQSEFIILNNTIEYRGKGDDQTRVIPAAGTYKIDLNFKTGTGAITAQ
jgi:hypothetical protein